MSSQNNQMNSALLSGITFFITYLLKAILEHFLIIDVNHR